MLGDLRRVLAVLLLNFFPLVLIYVLRSHETQANITKIFSWLQDWTAPTVYSVGDCMSLL